MQIKLWKDFSKRSNSTKRPADSNAVIKDVVLKQPTSIESPSFILNGSDFDYNYCEAFGHYYFITDITSLNLNQIRIDCRQDVLATWRIQIRDSKQFVMYSASDYDVWLPDNRVSIGAYLSKEYSTSQSTQVLSSIGCYSLTIANDEPGGTGAATTYILTSAQIDTLLAYFNNTITSSVLDWLQNRFLKPFDSIISCQWLPIGYTYIDGDLVTAKLGKDSIPGIGDVKLIKTSNMIKSFEYVIDIPDTFEDFRISAPYSKHQVYIPFYGFYDINPLDFEGKIAVEYNVDLVNGDATVYLKYIDAAQQRRIRNTINYTLGVNCALSQVTRTGDGAVTSLAGSAGALLTAVGASTGAGAVAGVLSASVAAGNAVISANNVTTSVKGSISGRSMGLNLRPFIMVTSYDTMDPDSLRETQGRPLMQEKTLSTLSGYCQCVNASIQIPGLSSDRDEVNALLNSGIYLE